MAMAIETIEEESPIITLAKTLTREQLAAFYVKVTMRLQPGDTRASTYTEIVRALEQPWRYQSETALKDLRKAVSSNEMEEQQALLIPLVNEAIDALTICKPLYAHWSVAGTEFKAALAKLKDAISSRSTLPILSNVLIEPDEISGVIWLSATNLEISIKTSVEAHIECAGGEPLTMPYALLVDECKQIPSTKEGKIRRITLQEVKEGETVKVQVTNGPVSTTYKRGISAQEFPSIPVIQQVELPNPFVFQSDDLRRIISLTEIAAAIDESRPVMCGTLIQLKESRGSTREIEIVCTDAFRLATITYESMFMPEYSQYDEEAPVGVLVPTRTMHTLYALLPDDTSDVFIYHVPQKSHVQIVIPGSNITLVSRTIDGTFPNFHQIIPRDEQCGVYIEASIGALKKAYQGVAMFAKDSSNITRFIIERVQSDNDDEQHFQAQVTAEVEDLGKRVINITEDVHNVDFTRGQEDTDVFGIIFNCKYILDLLERLERAKIDRVRLYLQSPTKPGKLVPIGLETYSYTIMSMHINR